MTTEHRWPRGELNSWLFGDLPKWKGKRRDAAAVNESIDRKLAEGRQKIEQELGVRIRQEDLEADL
jgi:hypothetical protein